MLWTILFPLNEGKHPPMYNPPTSLSLRPRRLPSLPLQLRDIATFNTPPGHDLLYPSRGACLIWRQLRKTTRIGR
eukprot:4652388-Prorocentrum_lima.AAC.1